jgi:hypothetical protein
MLSLVHTLPIMNVGGAKQQLQQGTECAAVFLTPGGTYVQIKMKILEPVQSHKYGNYRQDACKIKVLSDSRCKEKKISEKRIFVGLRKEVAAGDPLGKARRGEFFCRAS